MKTLTTIAAVLFFSSCINTDQQSDSEKATRKNNGIEITTDSGAVKINEEGVSITNDSVSIRINEREGIRVEDKDGKVEINSQGDGNIKVETKKKELKLKVNGQ